jgi:hypothetical protein
MEGEAHSAPVRVLILLKDGCAQRRQNPLVYCKISSNAGSETCVLYSSGYLLSIGECAERRGRVVCVCVCVRGWGWGCGGRVK